MHSAHEMSAFVRAVERGGFSAAARDLGLTPSALSKLVTRLENRLGVRLLNRTTRKLAMTAEGEVYFERSQRILAEIEDAETEVANSRGQPRGRLRINTGVAFGMHQMAPALPDFLARYPEIGLELTVTDRVVDLLEEGADVAVRTGRLADSSLIARKICDLERTICAAPAYLKRHGRPKSPADLAHHNCMTIAGVPQLKRWPFDSAEGPLVIEVSGSVSANNAETLLQLAEAGAGLVRLSEVIVAESLHAGRLVSVLADCHHVEPLPMQAVYPHGRHRSPKVTVFVNWLLERFSSAPWRRPVATAKKSAR